MAKKRQPKASPQHPNAPQRFEAALSRVLKVSKAELDRREAEYKKTRREKRERDEQAIRDAMTP